MKSTQDLCAPRDDLSIAEHGMVIHLRYPKAFPFMGDRENIQ